MSKDPKTHPFIALTNELQAERNLTEAAAIRMAADTDPDAMQDYIHTTGLGKALQLGEEMREAGDLKNHDFNRLVQVRMKATGCGLAAAMRWVVAEHPHIHASFILAAQKTGTN